MKIGLAAVLLCVLSISAFAAENAAEKPQPAPATEAAKEACDCKPEKGAPLPLHNVEGCSGIFITSTAYMCNPPSKDKWFGLPTVEGHYANLSDGKFLTSTTLTENILGRIETGFAWEHFDLGHLPRKLTAATGLKVDRDAVDMLNANLRGMLVKEGEYASWVPAVTAGLHFKYNLGYNELNNDLGHTLSAIGVTRKDDLEYTLVTTKLFKQLPRPFLVSAGLRASRDAQTGLLGFTRDYHATAEANFGLFIRDNLLLAGEYRQKLCNYKTVGALVGHEHDWFTVDVAYLINTRGVFTVGYGYFGQVLDTNAKAVWGAKFKWEF